MPLANIVWVSLGKDTRVYHHAAPCGASRTSRRLPTVEAAALRAGLAACEHCTPVVDFTLDPPRHSPSVALFLHAARIARS